RRHADVISRSARRSLADIATSKFAAEWNFLGEARVPRARAFSFGFSDGTFRDSGVTPRNILSARGIPAVVLTVSARTISQRIGGFGHVRQSTGGTLAARECR